MPCMNECIHVCMKLNIYFLWLMHVVMIHPKKNKNKNCMYSVNETCIDWLWAIEGLIDHG